MKDKDMESTYYQLWLFAMGLRETMAIVHFSYDYNTTEPSFYIKAWRALDK